MNRLSQESQRLQRWEYVNEEHTGIWNDGVECDNEKGITLSDNAKYDLEEIDRDYWEWIYDCGKRVSVRVILWLVALRLAYEAVGSKEAGNG